MSVLEFRVTASQAELYDIGEGLERLLADDADLPYPCLRLILALDEAVNEAVEGRARRRWQRALARTSTHMPGVRA